MSRSSAQGGWAPGQIWTDGGEIASLEDRHSVTVTVKNTGDRPIQVGSHFHFFEVNKALDFPRAQAWGFRLAIAAGTAVRFEPGLEYEVGLIALGGQRVVYGFNGLTSGKLDDPAVKARAFDLARDAGFKGI